MRFSLPMMSETPPALPRLTVSAKPVFLALAIAAVIFALLGFGAEYAGTMDDHDVLWAFARLFDFGQEGNFINWYQSVTLFGCACLAGIIAFLKKRAGAPHVPLWALMALVMAFVGIDEAAQIHDRTLNAVIASLSGDEEPAAKKPGGDDKEYGSSKWMLIYVPAVVVLAAMYFRFFLALPKRTRWGFVIAAVFYVGGAVGLELIYEKVSEDTGGDTVASFAVDAASELCEMLGVAVFAGTLTAYLGREHGAMRVDFQAAEP